MINHFATHVQHMLVCMSVYNLNLYTVLLLDHILLQAFGTPDTAYRYISLYAKDEQSIFKRYIDLNKINMPY